MVKSPLDILFSYNTCLSNLSISSAANIFFVLRSWFNLDAIKLLDNLN